MDLDQIRQRRMQELQAQAQSTAQQSKESNEDKSREAEAKHGMLSQVLDASARERLSRISIVKPARASQIEDMIIRMAQQGQIRQRVTEKELIGLLDKIAEQEESSSKMKLVYSNRRQEDDEEEDLEAKYGGVRRRDDDSDSDF